MNDEPTALGSVIDPWHHSFYEAIREADVTAIEPLLAGDVVLMPANERTVSGRNAVCAWLEQYFKNFNIDEAIETQRSVTIVEKCAFEWGAYSVKIRSLNPASSNMIVDEHRFLYVWQLHAATCMRKIQKTRGDLK